MLNNANANTTNANTALYVSPNDHTPPEIKILNGELQNGHNILHVMVTDASDIKRLQVDYVDEGNIVTKDIIKDHGNLFFSLINVHPPSCIIVINAMDAANNTATIAKEFKVIPTNPFDEILSWIKGLLSSIGLS
jgi:hypothetical protein